MNLYPSIDLKSGECVRLSQGDFTRCAVYSSDPKSVLDLFREQGAERCHVVDLDGARRGTPMQTALIIELARHSPIKIQVGGGIRTEHDISTLLDNGIDRVVLGSIACRQVDLVKSWIKTYGSEKFVLAFDVRLSNMMPMIAEHGWQKTTMMNLWEILEMYADSGLKHVLCTDISVDGMLNGPNLALYSRCQREYPSIQWQASGGIGQLSDLQALEKLGLSGAIIGKALYENKFSLSEAIVAVRSC